MKKHKKFGRKLALNKQTIANMEPKKTRKVYGGMPTDPCNNTIVSEVICSCQCDTVLRTCAETCGDAHTCVTCEVSCYETQCGQTECKIPCPCQEPLTY